MPGLIGTIVVLCWMPVGYLVLCFIAGRPWRRLARHYPCPSSVVGESLCTHPWVGWSGHKHGYLVANETGLMLRVSLIDSPFHRRVFVPWGDLKQIGASRHLLGSWVLLEPARLPNCRIGLPAEDWKALASLRHDRLAGDTSSE